jgi:uncharacterized protein YceK
MKNKVLILSCVILLNGCSTIFTNANEVEPGIYTIRAHGNVFNSPEAILAKALQKAEKKCGHANFEMLDDVALGNTKVYNTTIGGDTNSPNVTIKVDCGNEQ